MLTSFDKAMTACYYNLMDDDDGDDEEVDGDDVDDGDDEGQVMSRVLPLQFPVKLLNLLKRRSLSPPRVGIIAIINIMIKK